MTIPLILIALILYLVYLMINHGNCSQIVWWIDKMFKHATKHKWYHTYWFIDLHGVISKPDYRKISKTIDYYPDAKKTLKYITEHRPDIVLILFTSSYPEEIEKYVNIMKQDGIVFKYVNENPEINDGNGSFGCYDKKPYYNVLLDDKAGFNPYENWSEIYKYLSETTYMPMKYWKQKTKEEYHGS
jgi:hypothetical protein